LSNFEFSPIFGKATGPAGKLFHDVPAGHVRALEQKTPIDRRYYYAQDQKRQTE